MTRRVRLAIVAVVVALGLVGGAAAIAATSRAPSSVAPGGTTAHAGAADPSGQPMPRGNQPHWRQELAQDFTTAAPLGTFAARYHGYAGYDGMHDTSRNFRPASTQGLWISRTTSSVHDGMFDCVVRTIGTQPQVCAVTPTTTGRWWEGQRYGKYVVRFRSDPVPGYKLAFLLWSQRDVWGDGELDFPEAPLDAPVTAAAHQKGADPAPSPFFVQTTTSMTSWHTATIEWTPGRVTYRLDGRSWTTTDPRVVPTAPMRWELQVESALSPTAPSPSATGHVQIDWLTEYAWVP